MILLLNALEGLLLPPLFSVPAYKFLARYWAGGYFGFWGVSASISLVIALLLQEWSSALGFAASAIVALILWWWSRRKRKRSLKALGSKARARLAAMMRNMPRPGPVLRPVPQGVPAAS